MTTPQDPEGFKQRIKDHLEFAWGIIANAGGGDWTKESKEWATAAAKWRDEYHAILKDVWPIPSCAIDPGAEENIKEANTSTKYLPCPFCGSSDIDPEAVLARSLDGTEKHHAGCMDCGATTDRDWNDRTGAIPESFIRSMKDMEEGRVHDMEKVLSEPPPFDTIERVERITKAAKEAWNKATPEEREALAKGGAEKMSAALVENQEFYNGIEWFACWLLDHAEGETISEEQLRPWAVEAWKERLNDRDRAAPVREELKPYSDQIINRMGYLRAGINDSDVGKSGRDIMSGTLLALEDVLPWIIELERNAKSQACPHIVTSKEGTAHCRLAESAVKEFQPKMHDAICEKVDLQHKLGQQEEREAKLVEALRKAIIDMRHDRLNYAANRAEAVLNSLNLDEGKV